VQQSTIGSLVFFFFTLTYVIHIAVDKHAGPDGLFRMASNADPAEKDDIENWLDNSYSFCIILLNDWIFLFALTPALSSPYVRAMQL